MKRIMLSVFAAAITAAWVVPASAADVTFSGQYRARGEFRDNADFREDNNDNTAFIEQRVRLTANAKATEDTSVKITLQDTRLWGAAQAAAGGPALTDSGNNFTDLHESYVNIEKLAGQPLALRVGRQELVYGDERLIGSFGWSNNGRSFDAIKLMYTHEMANLDLFASKIRESNSTAVAAQDPDQDFYGAYLTTKAIPNNTLDLYALLLRDASATQFITSNQSIGAGVIEQAQTLWTLGARLKGAVAGLDYTVEVPFQFGEINTTANNYDISAYAFAGKVSYTLPMAMKVKIGAEYDYATGDENGTAGNTDFETFSNLFPTNHDKLGYADQQGWRNVSAWSVNASADVTEKLRLYAAYWSFSLAEEADGWYAAGNWNNSATGAVRAASAANTQDEVGSEIDLVATYKHNNAVTVEAGYSRFFTGDFIDAKVAAIPGTVEDQDWAYLQITANF